VNLEAFTRAMKANSPTILSAAAIGGVIATTVLTVKAAMKAKEVLDMNEVQPVAEGVGMQALTNRQKIELTWKFYIPPAISAAATIASIVGANRVGLRQQAALVAAYGIVNTAFDQYKEEVVKVIGEAKQKKVEETVAVRQMQENPPPDSQLIITSGGDEIIYDVFTGRYFRGNIETIRQTVNQFNADLLGGNMCDDLNAFYALLHLDPVDVGNLLGFNIQTMVNVGFGSHLTEDGRAAVAMFFREHPIPDFTKI
jgi:hypothetical protein